MIERHLGIAMSIVLQEYWASLWQKLCRTSAKPEVILTIRNAYGTSKMTVPQHIAQGVFFIDQDALEASHHLESWLIGRLG